MLALAVLLVSTMTSSDAFMVGRPSAQSYGALYQQCSNEEPMISDIETVVNGDHENPFEVSSEAVKATATGTLLAMSLFFAPLQTVDSQSTFFSVQPAVAAKTVEPAGTLPPQEIQLKSAKSAMAEATQSVKGVESKLKGLEATLKKTEQTISSTEKTIQKSKKAVQQAEKKYRELTKQKKPAKALDKESQKVGTFFICCPTKT